MSQENSDPLPYTQIDRALKPKVVLLAGKLGVTTQHATGSLSDFWELNGDPRELEKILKSGKREVLITGAEFNDRFELASGGKSVPPSVFVTLGLLERRGDDLYRVRGMSRYFDPVESRLAKHDAAVAGGKARAAGGVRSGGRFVSKAAIEKAFEATVTGAGGLAGDPAGHRLVTPPATVQPPTSQPPADDQPAGQPVTSEQPPQRAADSGQRSATAFTTTTGDRLWLWIRRARFDSAIAPEAEMPPALPAWREAREAEGFTDDEISGAYLLYLRDEDFRPKDWPTRVFLSDAVWQARMRKGQTAPRQTFDRLSGVRL